MPIPFADAAAGHGRAESDRERNLDRTLKKGEWRNGAVEQVGGRALASVPYPKQTYAYA